MRALILLLASIPAFAMSNAVTLTNYSGSTVTNYVKSFPRYFADKEICLNPRPYSGGSAVSFWQVDMKTRWPADASCVGGYARFALITLEIPTLANNGNYVVEFRSDASTSSAGTGLSKAQMLAFNTGGGAGSWGGGISIGVAALTKTASARSMLTSDHYMVIESGPLRTSILIREGPDAVSAVTTRTTSIGFQCTNTCTDPYASATWADNSSYYSIRPSYVVTFYSPHTGTGAIETDFLLDNGWLDRAQDQRIESMTFSNDAAETTPCYTAPAAFVFHFRARVMETCWSTTPGTVNVDFNRAYVIYTKVTPPYYLGYKVGAGAVSLERGTTGTAACNSMWCDFATSDQGATTNATISPAMGWGQHFLRGSSAGGGSTIIGFVPAWDSRYLWSDFNYQLYPVVLANANGYMHAQLFPLENSTTAVFHTGETTKAFGRVVSIDARPTYMSNDGNGTNATDIAHSPTGNPVCSFGPNTGTGCPAATPTCPVPTVANGLVGCMVTCAASGNTMCNTYSYTATNQWHMDRAHAVRAGFTAYLFSGKYAYLELNNAGAQWMILAGVNGGDPPGATFTRWGSKGLVYDRYNAVRAHAWAHLTMGAAALLATDGTAEKNYYVEKLNNNLEHNEGRLNITAGRFPPADPTCPGFNKNLNPSLWCMGRMFDEKGRSNPLSSPMEHTPAQISCHNVDGFLTADCADPWMESYWVLSLGVLTDWGFKADGLLENQAKRMMHWLADPIAFSLPSAGPPESIGVYAYGNMTGPMPTVATAGYLQTWPEVRASIISSTSLGLAIDNVVTQMPIIDWANTGTSSNVNVMDSGENGGMYWKFMDGTGEIVKETGIASINASTITAVDSVNSKVTATNCCTSTGLQDGQRIKLTATTMNPGIVGNSLCMWGGGGQQDNCRFWVHVLDQNTVEFHTNASLTSRVTLTSGTTNSMVMHWAKWNIARGQLGTTAASHANSATITYWPLIVNGGRVGTPDAHALFYLTDMIYALEHDYSVPAVGTGSTITAQRAYDIVEGQIYQQELSGNNTANCGALGLTLINCDEPRWGFKARPQIRNVRLVPASTGVWFYYNAPDGNACRIGTSTTSYAAASTDDTGDTSDAQNTIGRAKRITGLTAATTYNYRVTCGPLGGAARVYGSFTTLP